MDAADEPTGTYLRRVSEQEAGKQAGIQRFNPYLSIYACRPNRDYETLVSSFIMISLLSPGA